MHTFVCLLRSGGVYTPAWVRRLARNIEATCSIPHRIVCYSDQPVDGVECVPLEAPEEYPRWWGKLQTLRVRGAATYIDLDSLIVGDPARLQRRDGFWMVRDYLPDRDGRHNSSVMSWGPAERLSYMDEDYRARSAALRQTYDDEKINGRVGDQAYIEDLASHIQQFPRGLVVSYKRHARDGVPDGAVVVQFHGRPKPDQAGGWVTAEWEKHL